LLVFEGNPNFLADTVGHIIFGISFVQINGQSFEAVGGFICALGAAVRFQMHPKREDETCFLYFWQLCLH